MRLTFFENVTHNIVKGKTVYIKMIAVDPSHLGNIYHESQKNDLVGAQKRGFSTNDVLDLVDFLR